MKHSLKMTELFNTEVVRDKNMNNPKYTLSKKTEYKSFLWLIINVEKNHKNLLILSVDEDISVDGKLYELVGSIRHFQNKKYVYYKKQNDNSWTSFFNKTIKENTQLNNIAASELFLYKQQIAEEY